MVGAIIIIVLGGFAYAVIYNKPIQKSFDIDAQDPNIQNVNISSGTEQAVLGDDNKSVIEKVGELVELPKNELPSIATVTDVDKLSEQIFFAKAKNGDKVLVYSQESWAVIYRPSNNKIIGAASVDVVTIDELSPSPTEDSPIDGTGSSTQRRVIIEEE